MRPMTAEKMAEVGKKNQKGRSKRRAKCLEMLRGRAHEKTSREWAKEFGVAKRTLTRWVSELGERCKMPEPELKPEPITRRSRRWWSLSEVQQAKCELMAEWAKKPMR